jgi:cation:H+ antiporter
MLGDAFARRARHRKAAAEAAEDEETRSRAPIPTCRGGGSGFLVLGLVGLPLGADLLVDNATIIARGPRGQRYGDRPDAGGHRHLAAGAGDDGDGGAAPQADVALGNVIGSNMFNLLAIIGVATLFGADPGRSVLPALRSLGDAGASLLLALSSSSSSTSPASGAGPDGALRGLYLDHPALREDGDADHDRAL